MRDDMKGHERGGSPPWGDPSPPQVTSRTIFSPNPPRITSVFVGGVGVYVSVWGMADDLLGRMRAAQQKLMHDLSPEARMLRNEDQLNSLHDAVVAVTSEFAERPGAVSPGETRLTALRSLLRRGALGEVESGRLADSVVAAVSTGRFPFRGYNDPPAVPGMDSFPSSVRGIVPLTPRGSGLGEGPVPSGPPSYRFGPLPNSVPRHVPDSVRGA